MFRKVATRQDDVGDPPADRRSAARIAPSAKNGNSVALVDPGRDARRRRAPGPSARRASSAGRAAGRRRARRPRSRPAAGPSRRGRPGSARRSAAPGAAVAGAAPAIVADPRAVRRRGSLPMSAGDERPRVVGVDRQVRVAAGGDLRDAGRAGLGLDDDRPNGQHRTTAVTRPTRPVVRIRIGTAVTAPGQRRSGRAARRRPRPAPRRPPERRRASASQSARRIVTTATIGIEDRRAGA